MAQPAFIPIKLGSLVSVQGRAFRITHLLTLETVLAEDLETQTLEQLFTDQLRPYVPTEHGTEEQEAKSLQLYSNTEWALAEQRFKLIKPLLEDRFRTREKVLEVARRSKVHAATLYRWLRLFTDSGQVANLVARPRGRKDGERHLHEPIEKIVQTAIQTVFLSKQRNTPVQVIEEVNLLCRNAGLTPPHANTIRKRIRDLSKNTVLRSRGLREEAQKNEPIRGQFPQSTGPLDVVLIDHTSADIILVEEHTRLPMSGRPTITVAIDAFSRMIVGCYVSMEKPSALAVGMCLLHAILPKREYLKELDVPGEWPVWGKMNKILADNAKEFRGAMLKRVCENYNINLEWRPVKQPQYGAYIERFMGTSAQQGIHTLPGTTFSSPHERKGYDSEKEASLTLREFEQHLVDWIVNRYSQAVHSELNTTPARKWNQGLIGEGSRKWSGRPDIPGDPERLKIDFLPFVRRTVRGYGIVIDEIHYYHEVLNRWINADDPDQPKLKRQFTIHRDPRDISRVYFFDPEANQHFTIPYRDPTRMAVSIYELRAAQRRLKQEGRRDINEDALFEAMLRMRKRAEEAVTKTKAARRQSHRVKVTKQVASQRTPVFEEKDRIDPVLKSVTRHTGEGLAADEANLDELFSRAIPLFEDIVVKS